MNGKRHNRYLMTILACVTFVQGLAFDSAEATVEYARRGKGAGVVKIKGKAANSQIKVEQSERKASAPGGPGNYVDTGVVVNTNASGDGSVQIPNTYSGTLLAGHLVRVGTNTRRVSRTGAWFPAAAIGSFVIPTLTVDQETDDSEDGIDDDAMIETWEPGSIWSFTLDPAEASWNPALSFPTIQQQGDLSFHIVQVSSQQIRIQIDADANHDSPDDIVLKNLGITVQPNVTELHPRYELNGSSSTYVDGEYLSTIFASGDVGSATPIPIYPEPATALLALITFAIAVPKRHQRPSFTA